MNIFTILHPILTFFTRLDVNYRGKNFITRNLLLKLNIDKEKIIKTNGSYFKLKLNDFVDKYIYITGEYESDVKSLLKKELKRGDTFLDIGANIGFYSILASKIVGTNGKVIACEASPKMVPRLKTNISLNNISNIEIIEKAISNESGQVKFYISDNLNSGMSSLRELNNVEPVIVNSIKLDDYCDKLPKIKLIKIDIEGAEHNAIKGMRKLINRDKPIIILEVIDLFLNQFGSSSNELLQELDFLGYDFFDMNGEKLNSTDEIKEQMNVLFKTR